MSRAGVPCGQINHLVQANISVCALEHNILKIRQFAGLSPLWGVVKANAYGHGINQVVPVISKYVQGYACARLEEAQAVFEVQHELLSRSQPTIVASQTLPILILGGCYELSEYAVALKFGFHLVVHTEHQVAVLESILEKGALAKRGLNTMNEPLKLWLKINVGMNRLGIMPTQLTSLIQRLSAFACVKIEGILAHLGTADDPAHPQTQLQMSVYCQSFMQAKKMNPQLKTSLSNSAHLFAAGQENNLKYPLHGSALDWVRPGISLYGASPFQGYSAQSLGLKPVMTLKAKIVCIRDIQQGEAVGYGAIWSAQEPVRLFVLACGYGDGYPRHIENATAFIKGVTLFQAGRVSMDFSIFQCPISGLDQDNMPMIGEFVELWGDHISVDDVAQKSQSIGYERLTQLSSRVHLVATT